MIKLLSCGAFSHPKSKERGNQDSALPPLEANRSYIMAVADGVGSYKGSDAASRTAIDTLSRFCREINTIKAEGLLSKIKQEISELSIKNPSLRSSATTLTICHINNETLRVIHIGDCRLYIREENKLTQLTRDHTQYQKLIDEGIYVARELKDSPTKSVLTSAISRDIEPKFDEFTIPLKNIASDKNEIDVFIMSDGAHQIWEKRPRFSLGTLSSPNRFTASLYNRIERLGAIDDYTLVAAKFQLSEDVNGS